MMRFFSNTKFSNLTIKLLSISAIVGTLIISASLYGLIAMWSSMNHLVKIIETGQNQERKILVISLHFKEQVQEWKNVLLRGKNSADREKYISKFKNQEKIVQQQSNDLLKELKRLQLHSLANQLKKFTKAHTVLSQKYQQGFEHFKDSNFNSEAGDTAIRGIDREPIKILTEIAHFISKQLLADTEFAVKKKQQVIILTITLITLAVIIGAIIYAFLIKVMIIRRVQNLTHDLKLIAAGDFTHPLHTSGHDEIGQIGLAVKTLKENTGKLIAEISKATHQVDHAALEMSSTMSATQEQLDKQAQKSTHASSAMNTMNDSIKAIVLKAEAVAESALNANQKSLEGQQMLTQTRDIIKGLANEVNTTSQIIGTLSESSDNVGSILDVIKGISEQTNMLALNAAIEAARAGEQGRGFAVVADEVRGLAQRTAESAGQIDDLIMELRSHASKAVEAMEKGKASTEQTVEQSQKMSDILTIIINSVGEISKTNSTISESISKQSASCDDVNEQINSISQLAKEANTSTSQTTKMSQSLSELSSNLAHLISQFKVNNASTSQENKKTTLT
ncbi:Methyl-accepting chemotaxis protein CtpH [Piscirickettsiaceae bacterium NZ-RLO1]|nr:Methyl-accepting chemotaxis protein CtpH [Piscirickettsiaceae bacterium NZ-RLO1]